MLTLSTKSQSENHWCAPSHFGFSYTGLADWPQQTTIRHSNTRGSVSCTVFTAPHLSRSPPLASDLSHATSRFIPGPAVLNRGSAGGLRATHDTEPTAQSQHGCPFGEEPPSFACLPSPALTYIITAPAFPPPYTPFYAVCTNVSLNTRGKSCPSRCSSL